MPLFALLLAVASPLAAAPSPKVRPEAIRAHLQFLADDLLEGRGPGTCGYDLAANYVAAALRSYGLEPGGTEGSFFQPVPLRVMVPQPAKSSFVVKRGEDTVELAAARDYLINPRPTQEESSVSASLVFVGHGITAPERQYDSYSQVDARGKLAVLVSGAPASFPSAVRAHYSSPWHKLRNAVAHGAVGVLFLGKPEDEKQYPWARVLRDANVPRLRELGPDGAPLDALPEIRAMVTLSPAGSARLFGSAGRDFAQTIAEAKAERLLSFDLPLTANVATSTRHSSLTSANVAAVLRGSDPRLRHEHVVYTAHLDHLGIGVPVDGDAIYNGAYDNASGCAGLLEVARLFSELPTPPRRSVMFLFVTGEEKGLLGSNYFAEYPTVPIENIVANLNIDGLMMMYPPRDIVALGAEHSSLGRVVEEVAAEVGLEISPDPLPEQVFFVRSDQYSFVRRGIPALFTDAGMKSSDPALDPKAMFEEWIQKFYHTPKDDLAQPFDYEAGAKLVHAHFRMGLAVANATERPSWNPGDFFGEVFGRKRAP